MLIPKAAKKNEAGISFRSEVREKDALAVRKLCDTTGFFNEEEVEVAGQLVEEALSDSGVESYNFIFAENSGQMIGYSCFGRIPLTKGSFDLYWIVVDKEWQGKGLGKEILRQTEEAAAALGAARIYAETSSRGQYRPTISFYENQGYFNEAVIEDFYRPGDAKMIFVKVLG